MGHGTGLVAGMVAVGAAVMMACGGGGGGKKCDLSAELATQDDKPAPFVSLDEARRRVAFDIVLPASLPPGAAVTGVTLIPPPCADKFSHIEIPIQGPGWILDLDELAGKFAPSSPATPIRINGVDGAIERHMGGIAPVVSVSWTVGKRSYVGFAQLTGGLTEQQFLDILESIPE